MSRKRTRRGKQPRKQAVQADGTNKLLLICLALAAVVVGGGAWYVLGPHQRATGGAQLDVVVPQLSAAAAVGERLFAEKCSACHGENAAGSDQGPPLVHGFYEPNHHGDRAFHIAVQRGVRAHHWPFGDMPPMADVSQRDVERIIAYVRELQRANGIN